MKKYSVIKKLSASLLAAATILTMTCSSSFALAADEGGASVYTDSSVVHYDSISEAWSKVASMDEAAEIKLNEDWVADENGSFGEGKGFKDGAIYLSGRDEPLSLDLNGFKIDRGLKAEKEGGSVFLIHRSKAFRVEDSSKLKTGLVTGGFSKGSGGAFDIYGSDVTLENIKILGNRATEQGGGLFVCTYSDECSTYKSKVTLDGCELSSNSAKTGGAIYVRESNTLRLFDTTITGNTATNDAGVHTEISIFNACSIILGGKVVIKDNKCEKSGAGLMLDENFFSKVYVEYDACRPLSKESEIVILSKTDDGTLRITADSSEYFIECYEYENDDYKIVKKGSGNEKYLAIKEN